jgi:hypothetical protein
MLTKKTLFGLLPTVEYLRRQGIYGSSSRKPMLSENILLKLKQKMKIERRARTAVDSNT